MNSYYKIIFLIIFAAIFIRSYNFTGHLAFSSDQARDVAIARESIASGSIPLMGSFSSAGPFVFGPVFYWFMIASYIFLPFTILAPWIMTLVVGVLTVLTLIYLGNLLAGRRFSILLGLFALTSPQLIARSSWLTQHTFVGISTVLLLIFFVLFWQRKNLIYSFLAGIAIGTGFLMHYQAINLFIFFPVFLFLPSLTLRKKMLALSFATAGFLIISLPFFYWDLKQNWANTRNILDYLLIAQYRIYVANSWKLFLLKYFPDYWALVIGGHKIVSFIIVFTGGLAVIIATVRRKLTTLMAYLGIIFLILIFANRYYHGERFEGYLIYFAPFILVFSAWSFDTIATEMKTYIGNRLVANIIIFFILISLLFSNLSVSMKDIFNTNNNLAGAVKTVNLLLDKYPDQKLAVYDYNGFTNPDVSYALSDFLKDKNKTDKFGHPIGVCLKICSEKGTIVANMYGSEIIDLYTIKDFDINQTNWKRVNPEDIYASTIGWLNRGNLKSNFSLTTFILNKFN